MEKKLNPRRALLHINLNENKSIYNAFLRVFQSSLPSPFPPSNESVSN